jgi:uncharacterized protein YggT (Ycf19 family)
MQKVGNGIFLFVPNNVDISGEVKYKKRRKGIFPGSKINRLLSLVEGIKISILFWIYRVVDMVLLILNLQSYQGDSFLVPPFHCQSLCKDSLRNTEPLRKPFRRIRWADRVGVDLSPIFALLTLLLIRAFVLTALFNLLARILIY